VKGLLKRVEKLEKSRRVEYVHVDLEPWKDAVMANCAATEAGRPYSVVPAPAQPRQAHPILDHMLRQAQKVRDAPDFEEWQAACERRRAATVRAIEAEQRERDDVKT
jgi:hypothetical protein